MTQRRLLDFLFIPLATLVFVISPASSQYRFVPVWHSVPWGSGGLDPSSIVWSMVQSELDLDNDGKKEFLATTAWSGIYYNMVYLYESSGNNTFDIVWSYSFWPYSNDYSAVAVADLNGNGRKEILCLIDPADPTFHGFYVFEWDGSDNGFPALPTATWDLNLPGGFLEGTAIIAGDFDNDGRDEVAVALIESVSPLRSKLMIFSLAPGSTFQNPQWVIEFVDSITFSTIGYALLATDLDLDGKKEIIAAGWEPLHIAVFEHTGVPNSYALAADIPNITAEVDLVNMGFAEANFDGGPNELYMATGNGGFYVVTNPGDVSQMTASNVTLLHQYDPLRGAVGLSKGDIDGSGTPELYMAGSYHEAVFQWKYTGGPVTNAGSYERSIIFQDDTTDSNTPGSDQGYLRPSKVAVGDFDNDGRPDIVIASASFAADKPVLMVIELTPWSGVTGHVTAGWNLISNPVTTTDDSVRQLFPTSTFDYGFAFSGTTGYVQSHRLINGVGYWGKFPGQASVHFGGTARNEDSIAVAASWNLVGSVSVPVDTGDITFDPPGIILNKIFYGYNNGYSAGDAVLVPGKGYWIKTAGAGRMHLRQDSGTVRSATIETGYPLSSFNTITISDATGASQILYFGSDPGGVVDASMYDMPPAPPPGVFDARFESEEGGRLVQLHTADPSGTAEFPIAVRSLFYPLTLMWQINHGTYLLNDGHSLPAVLKGEASLMIHHNGVNRLVLATADAEQLPAAFALEQNYPNPFNPVTALRFAIVGRHLTTLKIHDLLGREIATLVNEIMNPGTYQVQWDARAMASGTYFYTLQAGEFRMTKRMILIR